MIRSAPIGVLALLPEKTNKTAVRYELDVLRIRHKPVCDDADNEAPQYDYYHVPTISPQALPL
jgi:hypothetical protein